MIEERERGSQNTKEIQLLEQYWSWPAGQCMQKFSAMRKKSVSRRSLL